MAETSNFSTAMKNTMLDDYTGRNFVLWARHQPIGGGAAEDLEKSLTTPFDAATGGVAGLTSNQTFTIPEGREVISVGIKIGTTTQLTFSGLTIGFPNGGDLIITQLDIEIADPTV